jgi:transcriptional regulator with XRE-family HTH domain
MRENVRTNINASQIRAARALLDWSQEELADASELSVATIRKIETGHLSPRDTTTDAIRDALETARIEFLPPLGVRLRTNDVMMLDGEDCNLQLLDDIYSTTKGKKDEVLFLNADPTLVDDEEIRALVRTRKNGVKWRFLIREGNTHMHYPLDEYRWIPEKFFKRNIQLVYGTKVAMGFHVDSARNRTTKIIVIDSAPLAASIRNMFEFLWENCRKPGFTTAPKVYE